MYLTPKKKQNSPYPRVEDYADSPGAQGWGGDDLRRRSRVLSVLSAHYRRFGVSAAHKYRARNHPDITEEELEDYVDEELSVGGSRLAPYINKSSGRILARSLYGEGRNPIDERNRASDIPSVAGPRSIEQNGLGDGEPIEIRGTVSLPKSEDTEAAELKNFDISFQLLPTGHWDEQMTLMNQIPYGPFNGQHVGNKVTICGYEARVRVVNIIGDSGTTNRPAYSWAGTPGTSQTTRTIPPIKFVAGSYLSQIRDLAGVAPQFWNAYPIAPPPAPGPNIFLPPAGAGTMTTLMCGSNATAPVPVGGATATFDEVRGPFADCEIQPQQTSVVNAQGFPVLPSWTAPASVSYTSYKCGRVPPFRFLVLYDKFGNDAKNAGGSAGPPSWNDLMEINGANTPPTNSLYSITALERFLVLYDGVHEPDTMSNIMSVVIPPKCIDLETIFQLGVFPIASGCIYLACGPLDLWLLTDPQPYIVEGVFRVFYRDH